MIYTDYDKFVEFKSKTDKDEFFYPRYNLLKEDLNKLDIVQGFDMDKTIKFNQSLMVKAIKYGMIIKIKYKGDKDVSAGSERSIYPMVLGINKNTGNLLIRGFHLDGWSVSESRYTEKVWRLFKTSNIISMTFTGNFFRLPPNGYKSNDRIMTERIIAKADFNEIRKNQMALIQAGKIESETATTATKTSNGMFPTILVEDSNDVLDLNNTRNNKTLQLYTNKMKELKMTFMKSVFGNDFIVVLGVMGAENKNVNVNIEKNKLLATYKVLKSITGDKLYQTRLINGKKDFKIYNFKEKIN